MIALNNKVSICIPVYNGELFLEQTLASAYKQTYHNVDMVIINDASADHSDEIITKFAVGKSNIIYLKNEINVGINKSCNKAVSMCSGNYILVLGQDDILPEDHIAKMLCEFDGDTSLVYCNSIHIDANNDPIRLALNDRKQMKKITSCFYQFAKSNFINSCGAIMNKDKFLQAGGYDEKYRNAGEYLLWVRLASIGQIKYCTTTRTFHRRHANNITSKMYGKRPIAQFSDETKEFRRQSQTEAIKYGKLTTLEILITKTYHLIRTFYVKCRRIQHAMTRCNNCK